MGFPARRGHGSTWPHPSHAGRREVSQVSGQKASRVSVSACWSLQPLVVAALAESYAEARLDAADATGLPPISEDSAALRSHQHYRYLVLLWTPTSVSFRSARLTLVATVYSVSRSEELLSSLFCPSLKLFDLLL